MNAKAMIGFGAAMLAASVFAEGLTSGTVGYNSFSLKKDTYYMFAVQFDDVSAAGDGIRICDLVKPSTTIPYGSQIQIMNADGTTYSIYKFLQELYDPATTEFINDNWGDVGEELAIRKLVAGTAFWMKATADCDVSIAGAVLADASTELEIAGGKFVMFANPYPVTVNPNALTWTGLSYGDQIQVRDANGTTYSIYKFLKDLYDPATDSFITDAWGDVGEEKVSTGIIPVGQSAWIKTATDASVTWVNPLDK